MLQHGLGSPVIIGFFPRLQTSDGATPLTLASGTTEIDTGNYSPDATVAVADQNNPNDALLGDKLLSSVGGALLGLLRGGSVLLRASRLSEIFMSKYIGLVRIVSSNWEHFTDACSDVIRNYKGRVYRYVGYGRSLTEAKNEDYHLNFYYGDTKAAETIKTDYNTYTGTPAFDAQIYKEQVTSDAQVELMKRTIDTAGKEEVWITDGTTYTRFNSDGTKLKLSFNDQHFIEINDSHLRLERADGAVINMNSAGIQVTFSGASIVIDGSSIVSTKGNSSVTMDTSHIVAVNGSSQAYVDGDTAKLLHGSHFCIVDSSGVSLG